eukprot:14758062-Alexandrium_andersonii.AAC.1
MRRASSGNADAVELSVFGVVQMCRSATSPMPASELASSAFKLWCACTSRSVLSRLGPKSEAGPRDRTEIGGTPSRALCFAASRMLKSLSRKACALDG